MVEPELSDTQVRRSELKHRHGATLIEKLSTDIDEWNKSDQVTIYAVQVSPRRVEYRQSVKTMPPVDDWSLTLADALHSFRAALDTLAWEVATLDQRRELSRPTKIYFPTATSEADWDDRWVSQLVDIPPLFLDRMKVVQAFVQSGRPNAVLLDLHQLDIDDKHRGLLEASCEFDIAEYVLKFDQPHDTTVNEVVLTQIEFPERGRLQDGNVVGGWQASTDIILKDFAYAHADIVAAIDLRGMHLRAVHLGRQLGAYVRFTMDVVRYGEQRAALIAVQSGTATIV